MIEHRPEAAVPRRPLLSGLYHAVPLGPDRVEVCNAGRSIILTGAGFGTSLAPLLALLDGTRSGDELSTLFPQFLPVLQGLTARGLLLDAGDAVDGPGIATATAVPEAPPPEETARRLRESTVSLAGAGPVSLSVAVLLAKAGLGSLTVERSHRLTSREVAANPMLRGDAIGRDASDVTRECVAGVAPIAVTGTSDALDADLVVVEQRYQQSGMHPPAADAALAAGVRYVVHGQDALEATIGPVVQRGGRPCHRCAETRRQGNVAHIDEHMAYLGHRSVSAPEPAALLAAHTSVIAGVLTNLALRTLLAGVSPGEPSVTVINLSAGTMRPEPLLPIPSCAGCATAPV